MLRKARGAQPGSTGADKAGPVKITKADGTVEIKPALTPQELSAYLDKYEWQKSHDWILVFRRSSATMLLADNGLKES